MLRRLKCLLVGHADDFLILTKPYCLRCRQFTQGRPPLPPLTDEERAWQRTYLREIQGWTEDYIADWFTRAGESASDPASPAPEG